MAAQNKFSWNFSTRKLFATSLSEAITLKVKSVASSRGWRHPPQAAKSQTAGTVEEATGLDKEGMLLQRVQGNHHRIYELALKKMKETNKEELG